MSLIKNILENLLGEKSLEKSLSSVVEYIKIVKKLGKLQSSKLNKRTSFVVRSNIVAESFRSFFDSGLATVVMKTYKTIGRPSLDDPQSELESLMLKLFSAIEDLDAAGRNVNRMILISSDKLYHQMYEGYMSEVYNPWLLKKQFAYSNPSICRERNKYLENTSPQDFIIRILSIKCFDLVAKDSNGFRSVLGHDS